jgi:hypothetical protein
MWRLRRHGGRKARKGLSSNIPAMTFLSKPNVGDRVIVALT